MHMHADFFLWTSVFISLRVELLDYERDVYLTYNKWPIFSNMAVCLPKQGICLGIASTGYPQLVLLVFFIS